MDEQRLMEMAKSEFLKYGCSEFAMARESRFYVDGSFSKLNIPKTTLCQWSQEKIDDLHRQIARTGSALIFAEMGRVVENYCSRENLQMVEKTMTMVNLRDSQSLAIVAETLLGRKIIKVRDGLIFKAYDMGEKKLAISWLNKTKELLEQTRSNDENRLRINNDAARCNEMQHLLLR